MLRDILRNSIESVSPELMFRIRLWRKGKYEREIDILKYLVVSSEMAIDIGANVGYYTYYLLKYSREVLVFEPNPVPAEKLRRLFSNKAQIEQVALSDKSEKTTMFIPMKSGKMLHMLGSIDTNNPIKNSNELATFEISSKCLDNYSLPRVGFIKIDVEGHELSVLKGALKTLKRDSPSLLIEAEERHRPGAVQSIKALLQEFNYQGFFIKDHSIVSIDNFDPELHQKSADNKTETSACDNCYINNFIFINRQEILSGFPHNI